MIGSAVVRWATCLKLGSRPVVENLSWPLVLPTDVGSFDSAQDDRVIFWQALYCEGWFGRCHLLN
jgi:hypothetical protein